MNIEEEVRDINHKLGVMETEIKNIMRDVERLVTRHEFDPIKLLVYGIAGCLLTGVIGAVLSRVLVK